MKIIIAKNYQELSEKAGKILMSQIWEKPNSVLGLATGSTPLGLYKELIKEYREGLVDFSKVSSFNLDEYIGLSPKHPQSYYHFMNKNLFNHINIKSKNINIPNGENKNIIAIRRHCREYEKMIKKAGGIDFQVLGIGHNGHIGFNEPGTFFNTRTHLVKLTEDTIKANSRFFADKKLVPRTAITMGLETIMESKKIILLVSGKDKADVIAKAVEGRVDRKVPASLLQLHPDVTVIIDQSAAQKLKKDYSSARSFVDKRILLLTPKDLPKNKNILVVSPHPDDAAVSVGAIIVALSKDNKVYTAVMTSGYRAFMSGQNREERIKIREKEVVEESKILGAKPIFLQSLFYDAKKLSAVIKKDISELHKLINKINPDIIFMPQAKDSHPTHALSRQVVLKALKKRQLFNRTEVEVWFFEGPWAIFNEGDFNTVFAFSKPLMSKKIKAVRAHISQIKRSRYDLAVKSLAELRSALIPEQVLFGFGQKAPKMNEYFELYKVVKY